MSRRLNAFKYYCKPLTNEMTHSNSIVISEITIHRVDIIDAGSNNSCREISFDVRKTSEVSPLGTWQCLWLLNRTNTWCHSEVFKWIFLSHRINSQLISSELVSETNVIVLSKYWLWHNSVSNRNVAVVYREIVHTTSVAPRIDSIVKCIYKSKPLFV